MLWPAGLAETMARETVKRDDKYPPAFLQPTTVHHTKMEQQQPSTSSAAPNLNHSDTKPVVIITIGMAGSGKTTFVQRINSYLHSVPSPSKKIRSTDSTSSKTSPKESPSGEVGQAGAQNSAEAVETNDETDSPRPPYILNLDPAVTYMPFEANIDIRDTINYAEVMKQYVRGTCNHLLLVYRR